MKPVAETWEAIAISTRPEVRLDPGAEPFRRPLRTGIAVLCAGLCLLAAFTSVPRGADADPPKRNAERPEATHRADTGTSRIAGWKEVQSTTGAFRVRLPGNPEISNREIKTPAGNITTTTYQLAHEGHFYNVAFNAYPVVPPDANRTLDGVRDGVVKGVNGMLQTEKRLTYRGTPGRELEIALASEGLELRMRVRIFLSGRRLYQVQAACAADAYSPELVGEFMNSFQFQTETAANRPRTPAQ